MPHLTFTSNLSSYEYMKYLLVVQVFVHTPCVSLQLLLTQVIAKASPWLIRQGSKDHCDT